uniref:Type VI secretion system Vgr family protein n=1 Tax=Variovorax paradoxus (strain S110) TaxID=543728 RepID=C5CK96_VARPS
MADHEFRIETDSPAKDDLMFWRIVGHEALARPSAYELTVLSKNKALDAKDILGRAFDVVIQFQDKDGGVHERHCQGHAVRFVRAGHVGRHFEYRVTLRSWFWLLTKRTNSRILQDKKVLEVLDAVFEDSPIKRFKKTKAGNVIGTHTPRRYCVQHQENDYQFLSRLLEDEGIYYWFDAHDAPGTMHLSDASDLAHEKLPVEGTLRYMSSDASEARHNEISRWVSARQFDTGKQASRDSDFKAIKKKLAATIDVKDDHELADFEEFEFPGGYFTGDDGENRTKLRGDELNARRDRHWALTTWPDVAAGRSFKFEGDPDGTRNGDYVIAACTFMASHPGYESVGAGTAVPQDLRTALAGVLRDDAVNADTLQVLEDLIASTPMLSTSQPGTSAFLITAIPMERAYRPPRLTPRVTMPGPQTAIVVGPAGDELHVDEHGRVKVHFHWDRYDESNEKSTCWVRVSQPWSGKGWGGYFIPRIGQEVIVDFINGDPDRPIVVGRVYNDDQPIPYKSPTQSGFKTRSTPGGGPANYNEIMFEDKKGEENINIHAERNMSRSVERDDSTTVGRDQSLVVERDQSGIVQRDQSLAVTRNRSIHVKNNESHIVDVNQSLKVIGNQENKIVGNQVTTVDGVHQVEAKGDIRTKTSGNRIDHTTGNETRKVSGNQTFTVSGNMGFKAATIVMETPHFEWKITGANSAVMAVPSGPYSIMANKFSVLSNTDASILAVGKINQTSIENNVTVMGNNNSGYVGMASETNMGLARSTFLGVAIDTFMGASISNTLALQFEAVAAAKLSIAVGPHIEMNSMKMYVPGGGAAGGGATVLSEGAEFLAIVGVLEGVNVGFMSSVIGFAELSDQYSDAKAELAQAARDAAAAGHPGLAARLNRLATDGAGTMDKDAPTSTQNTRGDAFSSDYDPFAVPDGGSSSDPSAGGDGPTSSEPSSSEPSSSGPSSSEPTSSEPSSSEPSSSEPSSSEPSSSEPSSSGPSSSGPSSSEPNSSEPNSSGF